MPRGAARAVKPASGLPSLRSALTVTAPLSVAGGWGRDEGRPSKISTGCAASNKGLGEETKDSQEYVMSDDTPPKWDAVVEERMAFNGKIDEALDQAHADLRPLFDFRTSGVGGCVDPRLGWTRGWVPMQHRPRYAPPISAKDHGCGGAISS